MPLGYQVLGDGVPGEGRGSSTLPRYAGALVGRKDDAARLRGRLEGGGLVTLLGPPGVGKTRLAVELARALDPARVVFCELATARDGPDVCAAMVDALGLSVSGDADLPTLVVRVATELRRRGLDLVVLDNLEQVVEPAAELVRAWSRAAPHTPVLVTSRHVLGLEGEEVFPLGALTLAEAVRLFLGRVPTRVVRPLRPDDQDAVEAVVARLDCLPLAIELAAARLEVLSLGELQQRLTRRFAVLRDPTSAPDARHGTLWRAVDWSWDLLDSSERRCLAWLSVFAGGCELAAAEAVLGGGDVVATVHDLVRKSLARRIGETGRVTLLEGIREYGWSRLRESPDLEDAAVRHAEHYLAAWEARPTRHDPYPVEERHNLAAVYSRATAPGAGEAWARRALRAACALATVREPLYSLDRQAEAIEEALHFLASFEGVDRWPRYPALLLQHGIILSTLHQDARAASTLYEALRVAELTGDRFTKGYAHSNLYAALNELGRHEESLLHWQRAVEVAEATGNPRLHAWCLAIRALDPRSEPAAEREALLVEAMQTQRRVGQRPFEGRIMNFLGHLQLRQGRLREASETLEACLAFWEAHQLVAFKAEVLLQVGWVRHLTGDLSGAGEAYRSTLALASRHGHWLEEAYAALHLALLSVEREATETPRPLLARAERLLSQGGRDASYLGLVAALRALDGEQGAAAASLARFEEADPGEATVAAVREAAAVVALCAAQARHERDGTARVAAERALAGEAASLEARFLGRALRVALAREATAHQTSLFHPTGRWIATPDGSVVDLRSREAVARVLGALVRHRERTPGEPLDLAALVEVGWPGERLVPRSARQRVYAAVAEIRRFGVPVLSLRGRGYLLDPAVPIAVTEDLP